MRKILVFFDAVGTLIYPDPPVIEVYQNAGVKFGLELSQEIISDRFSHAYKKHFHSKIKENGISSEYIEMQRWKTCCG